MDRDLTYRVHTFGCKVNTYDGGLLQKQLNGAGFAGGEDPRIHVLNTCAVTAEATKEAVKTIRRLKARDPFCTVVVTGCAAQVDTGQFEALKAADLIVANSHKSELSQILRGHFAGTLKDRVFKSNIFKKEDLEAGGGVEKNHTRAFLKIQDGCNSFCTYCVIPFARGKSRSIAIDDLVRRVNELSADGAREVVLTGVHIGDYDDGTRVLEDLVEAMLVRTKVPRFRLSSLEPVEVSDRLLELYQDPRLCAHFHMSIQSANTEVLAAMKRKYTQDDVARSLQAIERRVKNAFVGMDVIAGFPTETDEHAQDTWAALKDLPWTRLHVFPYSVRGGTRAEKMENVVTDAQKSARAADLRRLSSERYEAMARRQIGDRKNVLILNKEARGGHGLSRDYWPVKVKDAEAFLPAWRGQEIPLVITDFAPGKPGQDGILVAEIGEYHESH